MLLSIKRIWALALGILLFSFSFISAPCWAANEGSWLETDSNGDYFYCDFSPFAAASGMEGTQASPYLITSPEQLAALAALTNGNADVTVSDGINTAQCSDFSGKLIKLDAVDTEINLSSKQWIPIGTIDHPFKGYFNGSSQSIINMTINDENASYKGLFGALQSAQVEGCTISGDILADSNNGGIAGYAERSTIKNCINRLTVTAFGSNSGGIVGYAKDSSIESCTNTAKIRVNYEAKNCAGGIAGKVEVSSDAGRDIIVLSNCTNNGVIVCESIDRTECTGGIVGVCLGYAENDTHNVNGDPLVSDGEVYRAIIEDCLNVGSVTSYEAGTGGIVGYAYNCIIRNSTNNGTITGIVAPVPNNEDSGDSVGGIVGYLSSYSEVDRCSNTGSVTGNRYVGGIAGQIYGLYSDSSILLHNCENSGVVQATLIAPQGPHYDPSTATVNGYSEYKLDSVGAAGGIAGMAMDSVYSTGFTDFVTGYDGGAVAIINCVSAGEVNSPHAPVSGGVVGYLWGTRVENCLNAGSVSALDSSGEIAGYTFDSNHEAQILHCLENTSALPTGEAAYHLNTYLVNALQSNLDPLAYHAEWTQVLGSQNYPNFSEPAFKVYAVTLENFNGTAYQKGCIITLYSNDAAIDLPVVTGYAWSNSSNVAVGKRANADVIALSLVSPEYTAPMLPPTNDTHLPALLILVFAVIGEALICARALRKHSRIINR